jgi:ABC-2 type transport system ATP-binding protein
VPAGTLCAVLGHNGAGKTTLLEILATLLVPHQGRASVVGHDIVDAAAAVRRLVAYAPAGGTAFFPRLTGRQNLEFFAALHNISRRDWRARGEEAARAFGIIDAIDRRVDTYSDGMRQRLGLARAGMSRSRVWLLDEPTRGLDPTARVLTHEALRAQTTDHGVTMLISTHDLLEAETLCDQVVVLHRGRVAYTGATADLRRVPGTLAAVYGSATTDAGESR